MKSLRLELLEPLRNREADYHQCQTRGPLIACEAANNNLNDLARPCRSWRNPSYGMGIATELIDLDDHLCVLQNE